MAIIAELYLYADVGVTEMLRAAAAGIVNEAGEDPDSRMLLAKKLGAELPKDYNPLEHDEMDALKTCLKKIIPDDGKNLNEQLKIFDDILALALKEGRKDGTEDGYIDAALKAVADTLDRHSSYWNETEAGLDAEHYEGYGGIGALVAETDGFLIIRKPFYDGPAYKAGIRSGDKIIAVDGKSIKDMPMEQSVPLLKGREGTEVSVDVLRGTEDRPLTFKITRRKINVQTVSCEMLPGGVGLLKIDEFISTTADEVERALKELEAKKMTALILDLRGNPGGYFLAAVNIVDKFVGEGKIICSSKGRSEKISPERVWRSTAEGTHPEYPIAVLVDEGSASASEIVAGALKDLKRAVIIGERTYGKGSIQSQIPLKTREGAKLKLTTAKYYLPSGVSLEDGVGIQPDVTVGAEVLTPEDEKALETFKFDAIRQYVEERFADNVELFTKLALDDDGDESRYPDFEKWRESLETKPSKRLLRVMLRGEIRRRVADLRGREFFYDLQTDYQIHAAVLEMLKADKIDPETIQEYKGLRDELDEYMKHAGEDQ